MSKRPASPFDPGGAFEGKELLHPSIQQYRRQSGINLLYGGLFVTCLFVLIAVLGFQNRLPADARFLDPVTGLAAFALIFAVLRKMTLGMMPVILFYDPDTKNLLVVENNFFSRKTRAVEGSAVTGVALERDDKQGTRVDVSLEGDDFAIAFKEKGEAVRTAERFARAFKLELNVEANAGAGEAAPEPLYKKLHNAQNPKADDSVGVKKEKDGDGIAWNLDLPNWITISVLGFALANILVGVFIWLRVERETARWASIPFLFTTFVVFVLAAVMKTFKRPLEMSIKGISHRDASIPLQAITDIRIAHGMFTRLIFESDMESFSLVTTQKQARWVKEDVEAELWKRRGQLDQLSASGAE